MRKTERRTFVSGGATACFGVIAFAAKLAFPDVIVPFGWAMALLALGVGGLLVTTFCAVKTYSEIPEAPNFQVILRIEDCQDLQFIIKNIGFVSAIINEYRCSVDGEVQTSLLPSTSDVPPNGEISISTIPLSADVKNTYITFSFNFFIKGYRDNILSRRYGFFVRDIHSPKDIYPSNWESDGVEPITREGEAQSVLDKFYLAEATVVLLPMRLDKDNKPVFFALEKHGKRFVFDAANLITSFEVDFATHKKFLQARLSHEPCGAYFVSLDWSIDKETMSLSVGYDGEIKRYTDATTITYLTRPR